MIIYKTTNEINGKIYVGQSIRNRDSYIGSGIYIKKAIEKYGKENFKRETLCECSSQEELNEMEKYWIEKLNSNNKHIGYNISLGGFGFGKHSNETKKKIGNSNRGNIPWTKGKTFGPRSDETKKKISEALKGKVAWNRGLKNCYSDEQKLRMSHGLKKSYLNGRVAWNTGKKLSEETKRKIGVSSKGRILSNESRKKIGEASKKRQENNMKVTIFCLQCGKMVTIPPCFSNRKYCSIGCKNESQKKVGL